MDNVLEYIENLVKSHRIVLFIKGTASFPMCGFSGRALQLLEASGVDTKTIHVVNILEDDLIRQSVKTYSNWPTFPQLFVNGEFVGGADIMSELHQTGELQQLLRED